MCQLPLSKLLRPGNSIISPCIEEGPPNNRSILERSWAESEISNYTEMCIESHEATERWEGGMPPRGKKESKVTFEPDLAE